MNITHAHCHVFPLPLPPLQAVAIAVVMVVDLLITMTTGDPVGTIMALAIMTTSHGSVTRQTMVRIPTLSSTLFKWDYESRTTYAAETSLIVATLRTQPTSKLTRCLVSTDRLVQCKLTCGCANRSGNMSILGSAAKKTPPRKRTDSS